MWSLSSGEAGLAGPLTSTRVSTTRRLATREASRGGNPTHVFPLRSQTRRVGRQRGMCFRESITRRRSVHTGRGVVDPTRRDRIYGALQPHPGNTGLSFLIEPKVHLSLLAVARRAAALDISQRERGTEGVARVHCTVPPPPAAPVRPVSGDGRRTL